MNGNVFAARPVFRSTFTPPAPQISTSPRLGEDGATIAAGSALALLGIAAGAATAYVGFDYAGKKKGFKSTLGSVTGVSGIVLIATIIRLGAKEIFRG